MACIYNLVVVCIALLLGRGARRIHGVHLRVQVALLRASPFPGRYNKETLAVLTLLMTGVWLAVGAVLLWGRRGGLVRPRCGVVGMVSGVGRRRRALEGVA